MKDVKLVEALFAEISKELDCYGNLLLYAYRSFPVSGLKNQLERIGKFQRELDRLSERFGDCIWEEE